MNSSDLKSDFELWRRQIQEGHFDHFRSSIKNMPWLLTNHGPEIIQFIEDVMKEILLVNPELARNFLLSLQGRIDELQLQMWLINVDKHIKTVHSGTTRILGIPQAKSQLEWSIREQKKQFPPLAPKLLKTAKKAMPVVIIVALIAGIAFVIFHLPFSQKRSATVQTPPPQTQPIQQPAPVPPSEPIKQPAPSASAETLRKEPTPQVKQDTPPLPQSKAPEVVPMKEQTRIMLINASSMYQKGLAAKARKKLLDKGFTSQNILTGSNTSKVSRVYAYYSDKEHAAILKEVLDALYPGKEKSFFDISPKDRTVNGWILNFFRDKKLHILVRMPNEE
jgi:hypothetical protein